MNEKSDYNLLGIILYSIMLISIAVIFISIVIAIEGFISPLIVMSISTIPMIIILGVWHKIKLNKLEMERRKWQDFNK